MYHCYFLINYIGPPKVFFLSFGPLFKKFAHHWYRRLGGPQGQSGQVRKILAPPGFNPQTVQPVVGVAIPTELSQRTLSDGTLHLLVNVTVTVLQ